MKKIFYIASVVALSMTMSACNDFLDLTPQGTENSGNYFNSAENAEIAVNGIYDVLQYDEGNGPDGQWVTGHFDFFLGDMTSDDAEKGSTDTDNTPLLRIIGGTSDSSLEQAEAFWIHGFWGVSRANFVIEGLQSVSWNSSLRDRYMGEALFLRAYFNWYLVRMFGPIPLFTRSIQPSDFGTVGRTSVNQVYAQIAADLTEAAKLLPARSKYASADLGRATKGAAQALLARVYMYQIGTDPDNTAIGWKQVYDAADEVIKSGEYKLMSNYAAIWETENDNCSESVFEIQFGNGSEEYAPGSIGTNFYQYQGNRVSGRGWGFNNPSQSLYDEFETGDPRLSCTVYGAGFNSGIVYGVKEDYDAATQQGSPWLNRKAALKNTPSIARAADRNLRIIRYSDVLLMKAEAAARLNKTDEALTLLEKVRDRARKSTYCMGYAEGKQDYSAAPEDASAILPEVKGISGNDLINAILHERRVEFGMEGLRFYDLVRTGRFLDVMEADKYANRQAGGKYDGVYPAAVNQYFKGIRTNLDRHCFNGPDGHKVYVLPIPLKEQQAYGLSQIANY